MTDNIVRVEGLTADNATLLLAAAEELERDASVVQTTSDGYFLVPESVQKKSGLKAQKDDTAEFDKPGADAENAGVTKDQKKAEVTGDVLDNKVPGEQAEDVVTPDHPLAEQKSTDDDQPKRRTRSNAKGE